MAHFDKKYLVKVHTYFLLFWCFLFRIGLVEVRGEEGGTYQTFSEPKSDSAILTKLIRPSSITAKIKLLYPLFKRRIC